MSSRIHQSLGLFLLLCMGALGAAAQEQLTLRQAINQALGQNPEAAIARAGNQDATAAAAMARTALLPQLGFTEDISRGNDPVYAFGMRLRQRQFTSGRLRAECVESPAADRQFLHALLRAMDGIRLVQDAKRDSPRGSCSSKARPLRRRLSISRLCSALSGRISKCSTRSERSMSPSTSRRLRRHC